MVKIQWHMQSAWLLQTQHRICGAGEGLCSAESWHAFILLLFLCTTIVLILCAFAFFREDKEEQIKPLCPQLVVKESDLSFTMPLDLQAEAFAVTDSQNQLVCKVVVDWQDPFRPGASGVAATARLQNHLDLTLTTLVARNVAVVGQSLVLCRENGEVFASVEPDGGRRFHIRHRTNVHLISLVGDFSQTDLDIDGINPVGTKVCSFKSNGSQCKGWVMQHVDAGLVISSLLATLVYKRLALGSSQWQYGPDGRSPRVPGFDDMDDVSVEQDSPIQHSKGMMDPDGP